jgi:hypothetical protein
MAAVLWQDMGFRLADVDQLTLDDALVLEIYAEDAEKAMKKAAHEAKRSKRSSTTRRRR